MKKTTIGAIAALGAAAAAAIAVPAATIAHPRKRTVDTIEKLTQYDDGYNLYSMEVLYDYDLDAVIARGIHDDQSMIDAMLREALPMVPVKVEPPNFGCTAFTMAEEGNGVLMGRNYDFAYDSSALLTYCAPKGGYRSVGTVALDDISANAPEESLTKKLSCLLAPFVCIDGMNEKGVSIAILTLDSEPVHHDTGKPTLPASLVVRLVLDRAATTAEAVDLLRGYDMLASSGRDYHFYITDASGDGRVVEFDCDSEARELVATPTPATTNFYVMYKDKVLPHQKNGAYGHGRERYDAVLDVMERERGNFGEGAAWDALVAASQDPKPGDITSNTQWSIVYDNQNLTAQIAIRRNWEDVFNYGVDY